MDSRRLALFVICRDHGREVLVDQVTGMLPRLLLSYETLGNLRCHAVFASAFSEGYGVNICPLLAFESPEVQPTSGVDDLTLRFIPSTGRRVIVGQCFAPNVSSTAPLCWSPAGAVKGDAAEQQSLTRALQVAWDHLLKRSKSPLSRFDWFRPLFSKFALEARGLDAASTEYHCGNEGRAALRVSGRGGTLWLKASSIADSTPQNVLQTLAYLGVPHMPAVEDFTSYAPGWDALLQEDVHGVALDLDDRMESWIRAAEGIAEIQLATVGKDAHLAASGCPIWTASHLKEEASRLLRWLDIDIFKQQRLLHALITPDLREQLLSLLSSIDDLAIPPTLIRNSLSPMEVVTDHRGRPHFVGCEDAAVGFPFVWCHHLAEAALNRFGEREPAKTLVFDAYCGVWRKHLSSAEIESAVAQVAFVDAVSEAVRVAQVPIIAAPDRFIKPDKYEWAYRLTRDPERAHRLANSLRRAMAAAVQRPAAA